MKPRWTIVWFVDTVVIPLSLVTVTIVAIGLSLLCHAAETDEGWQYKVWTTEEDYWYVGPTVSYGSRGKIQSAKAFLKFLPKKGSSAHVNIKRLLQQDRINPEKFEYFMEAADVDCRTKTVSVMRIMFYDRNDRPFYDVSFSQPRQYASLPGSPYELISGYLCERGSSTFSIVNSLLLIGSP